MPERLTKEKIQSFLEKLHSLDQQMANLPPHETQQIAQLAKERKKLEPLSLLAEEWLKTWDEIHGVKELMGGTDPHLAELAEQEKKSLDEKLNSIDEKLFQLMNPPDPRSDREPLIEIRAGAGGDEAGLFVADLFRMYSRFAQRQGLSVQVYDSNPTGIGGFKEIIFKTSGPNAFGWFKYEQGVHRVQRVPDTEAQGRIHTSTATVAVLLEPTEVEIKVDPKDLRIDTYRSSGAGGQYVNKTDSAVRITHLPSGIAVQCQQERSQQQNRLRAMSLLRARLKEMAEEKITKEQGDIRKKQVGSGDRSEKIRTYNYPQDRITDHRINVSVFNIEKFMNGELDELILALRAREEEGLNGRLAL
ncbi:MAG: peptide chain release factor 1 [Elusimicrobia bacterium]|nr:peptide chain release factor 1 [Candidatus Obscuribacterium magneticum]